MTLGLRLSPDAEADIDEILEWSVERFGAEVRDGYEELISATLEGLMDNPLHPGTRDRPELGHGVRVVHLRSSHGRVRAGARRIRSPRHFVVYRQVDGVVQVVRVLHEAMDLPRHHIPRP